MLAVVLLIAAPSHAQRIDMRNSPHNLARGSSADANDPRKICVFCHTPTDAGTGAANPPRWQQAAPTNQAFIMFDDIGMLGNDGNQAIGSQSVACLSCHDAAQAFGVAGGSMDHPFAVPYRGALTPQERKAARDAAQAQGRLFNPGRFVRFDAGFRGASRGIVNSRPAWWVSRGEASAQRGRLDIPLFVRIDDEDQSETPFVECASCHDPHSTMPQFLRASPDAGDLCLTCHIQ